MNQIWRGKRRLAPTSVRVVIGKQEMCDGKAVVVRIAVVFPRFVLIW